MTARSSAPLVERTPADIDAAVWDSGRECHGCDDLVVQDDRDRLANVALVDLAKRPVASSFSFIVTGTLSFCGSTVA